MQKEIGIKELLDLSGTTVDKVKKMVSGNWYLEYELQAGKFARIEFTAKNFAEELLKLPASLQTDLVINIVSLVESPGDVLAITNEQEGKDRKMDVRVVRLNSDDPYIVSLLITR